MLIKQPKYLLLAFVALCFVGVYAIAQSLQMPSDRIEISGQSGKEFYFNVELAVTPDQRAYGLMNRTYLAPDSGMLFLFEKEEMRSFWMKDTLIPLDIMFLARNGKIHHIHHMAQPQDLSMITSKYPSMAVLEINGGMSDQLGIEAGDVVKHPAFRNTHLE